jgi:hypothetical protein
VCLCQRTYKDVLLEANIQKVEVGMSFWEILAIVTVVALLNKLDSIHLGFKGNSHRRYRIREKEKRKSLPKGKNK